MAFTQKTWEGVLKKNIIPLNSGIPSYPTPKFSQNQLAMGQVLPHRQIQREVIAAQPIQVVLGMVQEIIMRMTVWENVSIEPSLQLPSSKLT
jgi:hypothetical protein